MDVQKVLIVGVDCSTAAHSAKDAGYNVYASDHFGDLDLKAVCSDSLSVIKQEKDISCGFFSDSYNPEALIQNAKILVKKHDLDGVILTSGLEDHPILLSQLIDHVPLIGNSLDSIMAVRDKTRFYRELRRLNVDHPQTEVVRSLEEAYSVAKDIGYPVICKPEKGFGGWGIRKATNRNELKYAYENASSVSSTVLMQQHITGIHASASVISTKKDVSILSINEQFLGLTRTHQTEPFGYCGNMVPLDEDTGIEDTAVFERITRHFRLVGSNGVDFVISEGKPFVIEVNPRLQGTLECIERTTCMNLIKCHVNACFDRVSPRIEKSVKKFCARLILYSPRRSVVSDLNFLNNIRNVPLRGVIVEKGEPVCSVITESSDSKDCMRKAFVAANKIYKTLEPV